MATELNYQNDVNHLVGDLSSASGITKWQCWYLAEMLIGTTVDTSTFATGIWTVESCCYASDGTSGTLATSTSTNDWGTSYDPNVFVQGDGGSSDYRSWIVLKSPPSLSGGSDYVYLIIDNLYSNGSDFIFSKSAPSGGTTNSRPSSVDEIVFSQSFDGQNMALNNANNGINHYCHLMLSDGTGTVASPGAFFFYTSFTGSGTFYSALSCNTLGDTKTNDNQPFSAFFCGGGESGLSVSTLTNNIFNYGTYGQIGRLRSRNSDGSTQIALASAYTAVLDGTASVNALTTTGYTEGTNESDGNYNEWFLPVYAKGLNAQAKGRLYDVRLASGAVLEMAARPSSTPYEYIKFGDSWVPWTASVSPNV